VHGRHNGGFFLHLAARYREQGKIERTSELTSEIRKACTELRDKITSRQKG
jgi:hypothetical protein